MSDELGVRSYELEGWGNERTKQKASVYALLRRDKKSKEKKEKRKKKKRKSV
jgi:hypothetical protein